jgi:hypothetical protein
MEYGGGNELALFVRFKPVYYPKILESHFAWPGTLWQALTRRSKMDKSAHGEIIAARQV